MWGTKGLPTYGLGALSVVESIKILRNVDNYQSRRRNMSENLNLNIYLLLLPFHNVFKIFQFFKRTSLLLLCDSVLHSGDKT
jgi:hypothetical protein